MCVDSVYGFLHRELCQQGTNENGTMNIYCLRSAEFA